MVQARQTMFVVPLAMLALFLGGCPKRPATTTVKAPQPAAPAPGARTIPGAKAEIRPGAPVTAAEEAEQAKLAAEKAEQAKLAAEEAEKARLAAEAAEKAEVAAEEAEKARLAAEEAEKAKLAAEQAEQAKLAAEEAEKAKLAAEAAEKAEVAAEEAEQAKLAAEEAEQAKLAAEEAEKARLAAEQAEQAKLAAEEAEKAREGAAGAPTVALLPSGRAAPGAPDTRTPGAPPGVPPRAPAAVPREFVPTPALKDIHFDFDKYGIRPGDAEILSQNATWMKDNPNYLILIEGHADERGTNEYNLALGERRATSTMNYLVAQGVAAARITIISYGEERPVCISKSEPCWSENRRAHFLIKPM